MLLFLLCDKLAGEYFSSSYDNSFDCMMESGFILF